MFTSCCCSCLPFFSSPYDKVPCAEEGKVKRTPCENLDDAVDGLSHAAPIISAHTFEDVARAVSRLSAGDTLFLDLDLTVMYPEDDQVLVASNFSDQWHVVVEWLKNEFPDKWNMLLPTAVISARYKLCYEGLPALLKDLADRGVNCIPITSGFSDVSSIGKDLADYRIQTEKELGIDFEALFPNQPAPQFPSWYGPKFIYTPIVKHGHIFCCTVPKEQVVLSYWEMIGFTPQKIAFVDDRLGNVEGMVAMCRSKKVNIIAIHYTEIEERLGKDLDIELAKLKFRYLAEHNQWLSDTAAKEILNVHTT